jgi:hypothetical protein
MEDHLDLLDRALERELQHGCTEQDFRQGLKLDLRGAIIAHRAAVSLIRELREDPDLGVRYLTSERHPAPHSSTLIDVYVDDHDHRYWIDARTLALVQSFPAKDPYPSARAPRPRKRRPNVAPIRAKAVSLLNRLVPDFEERRVCLHPFEGNDDGAVYHFRWDDYAAPLAESEDPPFVHISISADGRWQSFTNTLQGMRA